MEAERLLKELAELVGRDLARRWLEKAGQTQASGVGKKTASAETKQGRPERSLSEENDE